MGQRINDNSATATPKALASGATKAAAGECGRVGLTNTTAGITASDAITAAIIARHNGRMPRALKYRVSQSKWSPWRHHRPTTFTCAPPPRG